jgi:hypothetical protein
VRVSKDFQHTPFTLALELAVESVDVADATQISEQTSNVLLIDNDALVDDAGSCELVRGLGMTHG